MCNLEASYVVFLFRQECFTIQSNVYRFQMSIFVCHAHIGGLATPKLHFNVFVFVSFALHIFSMYIGVQATSQVYVLLHCHPNVFLICLTLICLIVAVEASTITTAPIFSLQIVIYTTAPVSMFCVLGCMLWCRLGTT